MVTRSKREEPRVPFGHIMEAGFIAPGDTLVAPNGKRARVRADGSLAVGDVTGSIHRVGAYVSNAPACNGWTFWTHLDRKGRETSIDIFRKQVRKDMGAALKA
jgi:modification methylase